MSCRIKHLSKRNGTYYYSRRLPGVGMANANLHQAVFGGTSHYRVSLGTKIQAEALARFSEADQRFREKLALIVPDQRDGQAIVSAAPSLPKRKITSEALDQIEKDLVRNALVRWRRQLMLAELNSDMTDQLQREIEAREQDAEEIRSILLDRRESSDPRHPRIRDLATDLALQNHLDVESSPEAMAALMAGVRKGLLAAERAVDRMLTDGEGLLEDLNGPARVTSPDLSAVFGDYADSKTRPRTILEIKGTAQRLIDLVGNKQLHELTSDDVKRFCETEGLKVVGGRDPGSVRRPMSEATLRKKLALVRAAINRSIALGNFNGPNPASKIIVSMFAQPVPAHAMPAKRPFRVVELNKIFQQPWFVGCASGADTHTPGAHRLTSMHFWVPIIAALTGLRAGEIGGLMLSEIMIDDACPHILVRPNQFRSTKNGKSRRVPILDCLMDAGFDSFVESARGKRSLRLFEDWERPRRNSPNATEAAWSNGSLLRSFNRVLMPTALGLEANGSARREVTFHSFRGAFKSMLGLQVNGLPQNYINEVVGHSKTDLDQRYIGEIPIEETYPAMRKCRYEGLKLPRSA